jgi:hypothetical protein
MIRFCSLHIDLPQKVKDFSTKRKYKQRLNLVDENEAAGAHCCTPAVAPL